MKKSLIAIILLIAAQGCIAAPATQTSPKRKFYDVHFTNKLLRPVFVKVIFRKSECKPSMMRIDIARTEKMHLPQACCMHRIEVRGANLGIKLATARFKGGCKGPISFMITRHGKKGIVIARKVHKRKVNKK